MLGFTPVLRFVMFHLSEEDRAAYAMPLQTACVCVCPRRRLSVSSSLSCVRARGACVPLPEIRGG